MYVGVNVFFLSLISWRVRNNLSLALFHALPFTLREQRLDPGIAHIKYSQRRDDCKRLRKTKYFIAKVAIFPAPKFILLPMFLFKKLCHCCLVHYAFLFALELKKLHVNNKIIALWQTNNASSAVYQTLQTTLIMNFARTLGHPTTDCLKKQKLPKIFYALRKAKNV